MVRVNRDGESCWFVWDDKQAMKTGYAPTVEVHRCKRSVFRGKRVYYRVDKGGVTLHPEVETKSQAMKLAKAAL
jgi:hypothetical protein